MDAQLRALEVLRRTTAAAAANATASGAHQPSASLSHLTPSSPSRLNLDPALSLSELPSRLEQETDTEFARLLQVRRQREAERHPSFRAIPRFFHATRHARMANVTQAPMRERTTWMLRRAALMRELQADVDDLLGFRRPVSFGDDLDWRFVVADMQAVVWSEWLVISDALAKVQSPPDDGTWRLNYDDYRQLLLGSHPVFLRLLSAEAFLSFSRDKYGRISADALSRSLYSGQHRLLRGLDLSYYALTSPAPVDPPLASSGSAPAATAVAQPKPLHHRPTVPAASNGVPPTPAPLQHLPTSQRGGDLHASDDERVLSEDDLTRWVTAQLRHDSSCPTSMVPAESDEFFAIYVITAVRRFLFFHDQHNRRGIPLSTLLASPLTDELLDFSRMLLATSWPERDLPEAGASAHSGSSHGDAPTGPAGLAQSSATSHADPQMSVTGAVGVSQPSAIPTLPGEEDDTGSQDVDGDGSRAVVRATAADVGYADHDHDGVMGVDGPESSRPLRLRDYVIEEVSFVAQQCGLTLFLGTTKSTSHQQQEEDEEEEEESLHDMDTTGKKEFSRVDPPPPSTAPPPEPPSSRPPAPPTDEAGPWQGHRDAGVEEAEDDLAIVLLTPKLPVHREVLARSLHHATMRFLEQQDAAAGADEEEGGAGGQGSSTWVEREEPSACKLEANRVEWELLHHDDRQRAADEISFPPNDVADTQSDHHCHEQQQQEHGRQGHLPPQAVAHLAYRPRREREGGVRLTLLQMNWFSASLPSQRIYREYLELDHDQNGMLCKAELAMFRQTPDMTYSSTPTKCMRLTNALLDRIFEEVVTFRAPDPPLRHEMDFRLFLDFVLAVESLDDTAVQGAQHHRGAPFGRDQGLQYFWKLLDINKCGYLDRFTIDFFFRDVVDGLAQPEGGDTVHLDDVRDEIFDMVRPETHGRITLKDLRRSNVGHTVIAILIDVEGFWAYDQRENRLSHGGEEEDLPP